MKQIERRIITAILTIAMTILDMGISMKGVEANDHDLIPALVFGDSEKIEVNNLAQAVLDYMDTKDLLNQTQIQSFTASINAERNGIYDAIDNAVNESELLQILEDAEEVFEGLLLSVA